MDQNRIKAVLVQAKRYRFLGCCHMFVCVLMGFASLVMTSALLAQEAGKANLAAMGDGIVARVGEQTITAADIDFQIGRTRGKNLPPLAFSAQQSAVHLIALQRQALQTLRTLNLAASREEVETWLAANAIAENYDKSVSQWLAETSEKAEIEENKLRETFAFRLSWQRYLAKYLNQENLLKHFQNQASRFDGTRFKLNRISITVPAGKNTQRSQAEEILSRSAAEVAQDLEQWSTEHFQEFISGTKLFHERFEVVNETWIRGAGDLDPNLVSWLIDAEVNTVSAPLDTATGIHLLQLLEKESPSDAQTTPLTLNKKTSGEVRAHMLIYLLEYLASQSEDELPLVSNP